MTGFFIMENGKIQKNYEELKKKSELTEKFIKLTDKLKIEDKDIPKTEKGLETKAKEIIERLSKKIEKEEKEEIEDISTNTKRKRKRKNYYVKKSKKY